MRQAGSFIFIGLIVAGAVLFGIFSDKGETIHKGTDVIEAGMQMTYQWDQLRHGKVNLEFEETGGQPLLVMVFDKANHARFRKLVDSEMSEEEYLKQIASVTYLYDVEAKDGKVKWTRSLGKGTWYVWVEGTDPDKKITVKHRIWVE